MVSPWPFFRLVGRPLKRISCLYFRIFKAERSLRRASMQHLFLLSPRKPVLWILRTYVLLI
jgi:hypothetical protein